MSEIRKALNLDDIYQAFRSEPLQISELEDFYCDTQAARGGVSARRKVARILRQNLNTNEHILFVGYKGCGKSTELNHLQQDLENEFLVLNYSVQDELDPVHLNYIEIFIVTMERLFTVALEEKLKISKEYLKSIQLWIGTKEIEEIREKYNLSAEVEVGSDTTLTIPFLQKFFAKFKATAKSSRSLKETLKTNVEPKLSDLVEHCNTLIQEVYQGLRKAGKKDLLLIIEDLDKVPIERAADLFYNYAQQLTQLRTNIIFTFPISLYNSVKFNTVKHHFSSIVELPMIKVLEKDGSENTEGMATMRALVAARLDIAANFEHADLLDKLILVSGGCIRDLFRLVQGAADAALDLGKTKINLDHCEQSILTLKREYNGNIADNRVDGQLYTAAGYFKILSELAGSKSKQVDNTESLMHLRDNLCILGYNGEGWCDVHPVVKMILRERGLWDGKLSNA